MPRKFLKNIMPDHQKMREHPHLKKFGQRLTDPKLWHLNRHSVASGLALGLFIGFLPILGQMPLAAAFAILLRVNLPFAIMGCWISNPVTFAPLFYFAYKIGAWILQVPMEQHSFDVSWQWLTHEFLLIWQPLLLGSFICGLTTALLGVFFIHFMWRRIVIHKWRQRQQKNRESNELK